MRCIGRRVDVTWHLNSWTRRLFKITLSTPIVAETLEISANV